jgi:hypothetical protein
VWTFHFTVSANTTALNGGRAGNSVILRERQIFLLEHIKSRILHTMPGIVTFVDAFYDSSILCGSLLDNNSICIPLHAFVQTRAHTCCEIKAMQYWIPGATWTPISGGLASNPDYKDLRRRSEDQNDSLTEMCVFGSLSLNNLARAERKQLRQVNLLYLVIHHNCFNRLM